MRTKLDLVSPENSEISYKITRFPDGQQDLHLIDFRHDEKVLIKARVNNFLDLEILICAVKALRNNFTTDIALSMPYVLGARSDRKFIIDGGINYLKDVYAPIINSLNFTATVVADPHSDVVEATFNNIYIDSQHKFAQEFWNNNIPSEHIKLISPDAGALKKIYKLADAQKDKDFEVIIASKKRDIKTGNILSTEVPTDDLKGAPCLIVDDICDGGRTFIELAKLLKTKNCGKLYLFVTHGIFSKGLDELYSYFDVIGTTNSIRDFKNDEFSAHNDRHINKLIVLDSFIK